MRSASLITSRFALKITGYDHENQVAKMDQAPGGEKPAYEDKRLAGDQQAKEGRALEGRPDEDNEVMPWPKRLASSISWSIATPPLRVRHSPVGFSGDHPRNVQLSGSRGRLHGLRSLLAFCGVRPLSMVFNPQLAPLLAPDFTTIRRSTMARPQDDVMDGLRHAFKPQLRGFPR